MYHATSLDQRNTPTKALGTSLAKKLMPHHTTSLIPTATSIKLLHPKVPSMLKMKRQKSLMITSEWFSCSSPEIDKGQDIRVLHLQKNQPAKWVLLWRHCQIDSIWWKQTQTSKSVMKLITFSKLRNQQLHSRQLETLKASFQSTRYRY